MGMYSLQTSERNGVDEIIRHRISGFLSFQQDLAITAVIWVFHVSVRLR